MDMGIIFGKHEENTLNQFRDVMRNAETVEEMMIEMYNRKIDRGLKSITGRMGCIKVTIEQVDE